MADTSEARNNTTASTILGICILFGLVLGGLLLGGQIKAMKLADRYVAVRGLVEREVKSNVAIWPVSFKETGNDLPAVFARSEQDKNNLFDFLRAQGIAESEVTLGQVRVTDKLANEYGNGNAAANRYIVEQTVTVQTNDVDKMARAGQKTSALVAAGLVLDAQSNIAYKFTGLNDLKPAMITEATRNARSAADRFAADSGSKVGSIRSASQGVFSITAAGAGAASGPDEEGGAASRDDSTINKVVRVVVTIDYYLEK